MSEVLSWRLAPLGSVLTRIDAGHSPDLEDNPAGPGQWGVLKVSAVGDGVFRPGENKVVHDRTLHEPASCVRPGDLLITRANTPRLIGRSCIVDEVQDGLMLSDKTLRLNIDERLLPARYVNMALGLPGTRRQIENAASGSSGSMKNISQQAIRQLMIPIGPPEDVRRIAEIVDAVDAEMMTIQRVLRKLESLSSGLVAERLASIVVNSRGFVPLADVASVMSGVTLGPEPGGLGAVELPYLRVANVQDGYIDTSEMKTIRIPRSEVSRYLLEDGDVLLTEGGDLDKLGRGAMWDARIPECICQNHIFRVRCDRMKILPSYLSLYTGSPAGKAYFLTIAKQTTNLASINSTQLKQMPIPVPILDEQSALIEMIAACTARVEAERKKIENLQGLKRGLMDDLLTGRVRAT